LELKNWFQCRKNLLNRKPIRERLDVQHVEQCGFRSADLFAYFDDVNLVKYFDGSTRDFGRNLERLEEGRLLRTHSAVLRR